jgi:uncharacterized protein GlcG (DUF336 family)
MFQNTVTRTIPSEDVTSRLHRRPALFDGRRRLPETSRRKFLPCWSVGMLVSAATIAAPMLAAAQQPGICPVRYDQLVQALKGSVKASGGPSNGGLDNNEWAAVVDRNGTVCAIAFTGSKPGDQWPGGRAIAVEKADAANSFALDGFSISTANLWGPTQPGRSLFGLQATNPLAAQELQTGAPEQYGTAGDPLVGKRVGGIVAFGGGLALYDPSHRAVGGLGVSGDTACADHNIAWRVRQALRLDHASAGPSPDHNDEIVYDVGSDGQSTSGWGHPSCDDNAMQIAKEIGSGRIDIARVPITTGEAPAGDAPRLGLPDSGTPH